MEIFTVGNKWRDMSGDLDGSLTSGATGGDDSCTGEFPSADVVRNLLHIHFACLSCHKCSSYMVFQKVKTIVNLSYDYLKVQLSHLVLRSSERDWLHNCGR